MSKAFRALRAGDKLELPDGIYLASGCMTLRTPDGSVWSEWLLCPVSMSPASAVASLVHRWLAYEPEQGLLLWSPAPVSAGFTFADVSGDSCRFLGRDYRVSERDSMRVESISGDVGGDASVGESFDYVDLSSGTALMSVEANTRGVDVYLGRRVPDHELVGWAKAGGYDLQSRYAALAAATPLATRVLGDDGSGSPFGKVVAFFAFLVMAVLMARCDDDGDCRSVRDAQTGQVRQVCDDGFRSHGRRLFGGAGGK